MIYQVTGLYLAALIGLGALSGVAAMALVKALCEHLAAPSRPYPRSPVRCGDCLTPWHGGPCPMVPEAQARAAERLGRRVS